MSLSGLAFKTRSREQYRKTRQFLPSIYFITSIPYSKALHLEQFKLYPWPWPRHQRSSSSGHRVWRGETWTDLQSTQTTVKVIGKLQKWASCCSTAAFWTRHHQVTCKDWWIVCHPQENWRDWLYRQPVADVKHHRYNTATCWQWPASFSWSNCKKSMNKNNLIQVKAKQLAFNYTLGWKILFFPHKTY